MQNILPKSLIQLANVCPAPLYVVGGFTRDFLAKLTPVNGYSDIDIAAPIDVDTLSALAKEHGLFVQSAYKNTGTLKLSDEEGNDFEFTSFRSDKYVRGVHAPTEVFFTDDIVLDAKRRDFTCNAVYYDVKNDEFADPLNGISAIQEKRITTVAPAKNVFGEDGLRLMRLARQAAQLGFTPDDECLAGAQENTALILDITPERIFTELSAILNADLKYGVQDGHYNGLLLLEKTGVMEKILPELTLGKGMQQRADFHNYDVLHHSLRAALYAHPSVRFAALFHDVGKPYCTIQDGNSYNHPAEGARIVEEILQRLKAPKRLIQQTQALVLWHMYDFNCQTSEKKLRRFFTAHYTELEDILKVKQADFSACKDDVSPAPTCVRWNSILQKMRKENTPFTLKQLAVTGKDILDKQIPAPLVSKILQELLAHTAVFPKDNTKTKLLMLAKQIYKQFEKR